MFIYKNFKICLCISSTSPPQGSLSTSISQHFLYLFLIHIEGISKVVGMQGRKTCPIEGIASSKSFICLFVHLFWMRLQAAVCVRSRFRYTFSLVMYWSCTMLQFCAVAETMCLSAHSSRVICLLSELFPYFSQDFRDDSQSTSSSTTNNIRDLPSARMSRPTRAA